MYRALLGTRHHGCKVYGKFILHRQPEYKNRIINNYESLYFTFFNVLRYFIKIILWQCRIRLRRFLSLDIARDIMILNWWKKVPRRDDFEQLSLRLLFFPLECIFSFVVYVRVVCYHLQQNSRHSASIFFEEANLSLCFEQSRLVLIKRLLSQTSRGHTRISNECLVKSRVSSTALSEIITQRKYRWYIAQ